MTRRWLGLAAIVAIGVLTRKGLADNLQGTRFEPSEVQHRIRILVDRGHATLLVERVLYNPGEKSDQALFSLDLPQGAVATSLKTLGSLNGQPHWFYGDLREAEEAAQAYQELTGIGGYYPKDPALLSWRSASNLFLQVFPCMPKQNKAVGYSLEMPMTYERGQYHLELPLLGLEKHPAKFTVEATHAGDRLFINNEPVDAGRILTTSEDTHLALEPYRQFGVTGELAVADTGLGRTFAHLRYALAKHLSQVPYGAYVVVGIDNSRSMGGARTDAVEMASKTLKLFPNAQVQILDFTRKPNPRFRSFVPVRTALRALKREDPEDGNGSEVDLALAEAERILAGVPSSATKRILFFTDTRVPERITPTSIAASVGKSGAIAHFIHVTGETAQSLRKDDEHEWASAARSTGGLFWEPDQDSANSGDDDGNPVDPYVQLVRPTVLYDATYAYAGQGEALGDLKEGSGFEHQGIYDGPVRYARLTGELWSKHFQLTVHPDARAGKLWSALVFGTDELSQLNEAEMMVLAKRGGAVSPVTSYLAIEPGVRPSTDGLTEEEGAGGLGLSGIGEGGGGTGYGIGLGNIGGFHQMDPEAFLQQQLAAKWAQCKGEAGAATVTLETHFVEVADVNLELSVQEPEKYACLSEAAWSLDLRGQAFKDSAHTWTVSL